MNPEQIIIWLRGKAKEGTDHASVRMLNAAADTIEALQAELRDEMHRHDRPQDFEVAEAQYLGGLEEKIADHLIANGVTVQEWISVKDRLPEDDLPKGSNVKQIKVLTALKSNKGVRTVRSQMRYRMTLYNSSPWAWKYSGSEITHWQYLPQPPKGD